MKKSYLMFVIVVALLCSACAVTTKPLPQNQPVKIDVAGLKLEQDFKVAKETLHQPYSLKPDGDIEAADGSVVGRIEWTSNKISRLEFVAHLPVYRDGATWLSYGDDFQEVLTKINALPFLVNKETLLSVDLGEGVRLSLFFTEDPRFLGYGVLEYASLNDAPSVIPGF